MSFLNVLLLGGAAAFLAPLTIHLLNRSRFQSLDWGAMHLLEAALQVNSRRPQWESWLLLLLRCLIPILLAIGLARPVLTSLRVMGAGGEKSIVVMLDNSISMTAGGDDGSAFQRATAEIANLAGHYRSAEFALWSTGGAPRDVLGGTTFDPARIRQKLAQLEATAGVEMSPDGLIAGIEQLHKMSNPSKQLVLVSDFQASRWRDVSDVEIDNIKNQLAVGTSPIQLSLLRAAPPASAQTPHNLSIRIRPQDAAPVLTNETYRVVGEVTNHGPSQVENVRVLFRVAGRDLASRSISVSSGAVEQISFACEFATAGWNSIAIEVEDATGLAGDNRHEHVVHVIEPPRVLIIDAAGGNSIDDSSGYLQLALAPFGGGGATNAFRLEIDSGSQLRPELFSGRDAIVLADVARLDDPALEAVVDFVREGGGLLIFAGPKIDSDWYNSQWFDKHALLPMKFGEKRTAEAESPRKLAQRVIQHPLLNAFNDRAAGDLSTLEFTQWVELIPEGTPTPVPPSTEDASTEDASTEGASTEDGSTEGASTEDASTEPLPSGTTLLELSSGEPWLAAREFGQGYVLQCATTCSDQWSNMPLRPVYVPLMQSLVSMATTRSDIESNVAAGEAIGLRARPLDDEEMPPAVIRTPTNEQIEWEPAARNPLVFEHTQVPGTYRIERATTSEAAPDAAYEPALFAVASDRRESDLTLLSESELSTLAERLGAVTVDSSASFVQQQQLRSDGQEIWKWLLVLLVAFLFGEILLGQKITRGSL